MESETAQHKGLPPSPTLCYECDIVGCSSTFTRIYDLARHKKTIHGPKEQCIFLGCGYATGRLDKMKEHVKKKHSTPVQPHQITKHSVGLPVGFANDKQTPNKSLRTAYDNFPELYPPNVEGFDGMEYTGDVPLGIGEIVQAHANFGSLGTLDQTDTIFDKLLRNA